MWVLIKVFKIKASQTIAKITIMGNDAGSKDINVVWEANDTQEITK